MQALLSNIPIINRFFPQSSKKPNNGESKANSQADQSNIKEISKPTPSLKVLEELNFKPKVIPERLNELLKYYQHIKDDEINCAAINKMIENKDKLFAVVKNPYSEQPGLEGYYVMIADKQKDNDENTFHTELHPLLSYLTTDNLRTGSFTSKQMHSALHMEKDRVGIVQMLEQLNQ